MRPLCVQNATSNEQDSFKVALCAQGFVFVFMRCESPGFVTGLDAAVGKAAHYLKGLYMLYICDGCN